MCYSAQVAQIARKMQREFGIRLDLDEAEKLFFRRLEDPAINVSRGFEANFDQPKSEQERRIKGAIDEHRNRTSSKLEKDLFIQKTRLVNAGRLLNDKESKKAREEVRIATSKIESLTAKLSDLRRTEPKSRDNRVFPMMYAGVIVKYAGQNVLVPMRYSCRPAGKPKAYDKKFPGLYNARRDNLSRFWGEQFGRHHALMMVDSFYENVKVHVKEHRPLGEGEIERSVVLQFTPNPPQMMLIACLWSRWIGPDEPDLLGFAAITDEPPADVSATGQDRCIINLKPEHVDAWLTPQSHSSQDLQNILSDRAVSTYQHAALQAA